ncbi:hypothetical protein ABFX02_04G081400 [Erythranthe guttata]
MGDQKATTLAKAKKELEELYLGVPDDSVNLTFQDLAQVIEKKKTALSPSSSNTTTEFKPNNNNITSSSSLAKLPSIDFNKSIQAAASSTFQNHHRSEEGGGGGGEHLWGPHDGGHHYQHQHQHQHQQQQQHHGHHGGGSNLHAIGGGVHMHAYGDDDDTSHVSGMTSVAYGGGGLERGGRRRPGVPHSNICTVCSNYIYICRHRCLVCGRVYCRQCVSIGMGEMTEGRKCIECLGRRFSQRYIHKAGNVGCCMGYRSGMKQQELKWAEKGPRRSGTYTDQNRYRCGGNSTAMMTSSISRSPVGPATPRTPRSPRNISNSTPNSFVMSSPYSPYSPSINHHPMPF